MASRPDLWDGSLNTVERIRRAATAEGIGAVDINYPQHINGINVADLKAVMAETGLVVGAINLRYDEYFSLGAFTNPNPQIRREAIDLTIEAGNLALELGAKHLIVWPAHDGYDYPFQVDYRELYTHSVEGFRAVGDSLPELFVSLEYKPIEPRRFYAASDMGTSMLIVRDVDLPNVGVTLDFAHSLMAGENPAHAAALALAENRLFGIHLNDGYSRADDGLVTGSIHTLSTLELLYVLQQGDYEGHIYFDTFPINEDPVKEAHANVVAVRKLWRQASEIDKADLRHGRERHDALQILNLVHPAMEREKA
jgi:xylose isomerase